MQIFLLFSCLILSVLVEHSNAQGREPPPCPDGTWSNWFNEDRPGGVGDWEVRANLGRRQPCLNPVAQHYELTNPNAVMPVWPQLIVFGNVGGIACINNRGPRFCPDLRIRYCCARVKECNQENYGWTEWFDIDDPTDSTGDYELLSTLVDKYPDKVCEKPIEIDAVVLPNMLPWQTGMNWPMTVNTQVGLICKNGDQDKEKCCEDYAVRFCCKLCPTGNNSTDKEDEGQIDLGDVSSEETPVEIPVGVLPTE